MTVNTQTLTETTVRGNPTEVAAARDLTQLYSFESTSCKPISMTPPWRAPPVTAATATSSVDRNKIQGVSFAASPTTAREAHAPPYSQRVRAPETQTSSTCVSTRFFNKDHNAQLITLWSHGHDASTIHGLLSLEESRIQRLVLIDANNVLDAPTKKMAIEPL
nr:hypothetical protein CTI12_AA091790 [Tanacetum cinerariifolium]